MDWRGSVLSRLEAVRLSGACRIQEQDRWVRGQCGASRSDDNDGAAAKQPDARFWAAVCLVLRQFDGLKAGYRARRAALGAAGGGDSAAGRMSDWDFLFLESNGDLYDVIDWQQPDQRPSWVQGAE
jgi:hypothetical protein